MAAVIRDARIAPERLLLAVLARTAPPHSAAGTQQAAPTAAPERPVAAAPASASASGSEPERDAIEDALVRAKGVVAKAAAELGMSRQALYRRMEKLGIVLERRPRP